MATQPMLSQVSNVESNLMGQFTKGGAHLQSLTPPPLLGGQNVYKVPTIVQANMEKLGGATGVG